MPMEEGSTSIQSPPRDKVRRPYRKLVIAGSILSLLGLVGTSAIGVLLLFSLLQSYNNYYNVGFDFSYFLSSYFLLASLFIIIKIALLIAILVLGFRLKTQDSGRINQLSKKILVLFAFLVVLSYVIPALFEGLFLNFTLQFLGPGSAAYTSAAGPLSSFALGYGQQSAPPSILDLMILATALGLILILGNILILLGGAAGLAKSKELKLLDYLYKNRKTVAGIIIVIVAIYAILNYRTYADNALALNQLNQNIYGNSANIKYMLSNESLFVQMLTSGNESAAPRAEALYQNLSVMVNNQSSLVSVFSLPDSNSSKNSTIASEVYSYDWSTSSQLTRAIVLSALYAFGLPVINVYQTDQADTLFPYRHYQLLVPEQVSDLQSMYELRNAGVGILLIAEALVRVFALKSFNSPGSSNVSTVGFGLTGIPSSLLSTVSVTTILNRSDFYDDESMASVSPAWIELVSALSEMTGRTFNLANTSDLFYLSALDSYYSYQGSQILYNVKIPPSIDLIAYDNNTLIMDLGNLNLSDPGVELYVDGNMTDYTRYWDILLVYNKHLGVGQHSILVRADNLNLTQGIYITPILASYTYLHGSGLHFALADPYSSNMVLSNVSVVSGIVPTPSIVPAEFSTMVFGSQQNQSPMLLNTTYQKFNFYTKDAYNNTIPNYTSYQTNNKTFTLGRNDRVEFDYNVTSTPIGTQEYFTVTYNTNYGRGRSILQIKTV